MSGSHIERAFEERTEAQALERGWLRGLEAEWDPVGEPPGRLAPALGLSQSLSQSALSLSQGALGLSQRSRTLRLSWPSLHQSLHQSLHHSLHQSLHHSLHHSLHQSLHHSSPASGSEGVVALAGLVAAGRLELEDPENPTRPQQPYRTVEESEE